LGGATSWEIHQQNKPTITQTTTIPSIMEPPPHIVAIIGIVQCMRYLQSHHITAEEIHIQTQPAIIKKLQQQYINTNQYQHYFCHLTTIFKFKFNPQKHCNTKQKELDQLAKQHASYTKPSPNFLTSTTQTTTYINDHEVVDNITPKLLHSRHQHAVKEFLCTKYKWKETIFNNIDWNLHEDVQQHCHQYRQFIIKLIHNWLPVASHPSQANENQICFRCNNTQEDQNHWYRCMSDDARKTRSLLRTTTTEFFHRSALHPSLQHLVIDLLYDFKITRSIILQPTCNKQQQIGWDHFIRGRISSQWIQQQNNLTNQQNGEIEWRNAIKHVFHILHEIWCDRNQQLHGNDCTVVQRRMETIIKPKLHRIYNLQHLLPFQDRQIFDKTIDEMIKLPPQYLERWINRHEKYLQDSAARESKRIKLHNTAITNFFTKLTPTSKKT
jgi:hypothetical protein